MISTGLVRPAGSCRGHQFSPVFLCATARGEQPPALGGDFRSIRGAEKVLADGEDWRVLGTDDDPIVREALAARQE